MYLDIIAMTLSLSCFPLLYLHQRWVLCRILAQLQPKEPMHRNVIHTQAIVRAK